MEEVEEGGIGPVNDVGGENLDRRTLFVRSIPFESGSTELTEFFSQFVPVKHAVVVTDEEKKSRGFGFVSFTSDDDTLTALVEAKKAKFKGRFLRVDIAKRRDRKDKDLAGGVNLGRELGRDKPGPVEKRRARLIIRNLPWSCRDPGELKKIFSKFGAVFDAYIPRKKGGQMCGFAFVTMKKHAAAERAVKESQGLKINDREVAVDLAIEKSKWEQVKEDEDPESDGDSENEDGNEDGDGESHSLEESGLEESEKEDAEDEETETSDLEDFDQLNNLDDKELKDKEETEKASRPKANRQEPFTIFVRNLPYDTTSETLKEHFAQFGLVKYALPVVDKATGLARGSAFVAFTKESSYTECLDNSPAVGSTSLLIADDVPSAYVFEGRVLSITSAVDRDSAHKLADRNSEKRSEVLGKAPRDKDKRNLFLLNEGRITERSKLAQFISPADLEVREKSYKLRVQQLNKNPTLHLSLTRLAIRNIPRAMTSKGLKALGRKAVVQFATEVKDGKRHPLSKEEVDRSTKNKHEVNELEIKKKKSKNAGVVKQAKVIQEVKGSSESGRSRGYGFIEFRDHKAALMGLRWLNAHEVSVQEVLEGMNDEEKKFANLEGMKKRHLIAEFAVENAQVVKRRQERFTMARSNAELKKRQRDEDTDPDGNDKGEQAPKRSKKADSKKGAKPAKGKPSHQIPEKASSNKSGLSEDVKKIIGLKRKKRKSKK